MVMLFVDISWPQRARSTRLLFAPSLLFPSRRYHKHSFCHHSITLGLYIVIQVPGDWSPKGYGKATEEKSNHPSGVDTLLSLSPANNTLCRRGKTRLYMNTNHPVANANKHPGYDRLPCVQALYITTSRTKRESSVILRPNFTSYRMWIEFRTQTSNLDFNLTSS